MEIEKAPSWMEGGKLNEVAFAEEFLKQHQMACCDGVFFSREGRVADERLLKRAIYKMLSSHVTYGISRKVDSVLAAMRLACPQKNLALDPQVIHVANGTYHTQNGFSPEKQFCRHRLPVQFDFNFAAPINWCNFLDQLLAPEDIETLQEFMGYCLIPTTKAQKMLLITGNGGEGKSRIGVVMKAILGSNLSLGSIAKIEVSPFARADLEHLLVMVDDDMQMEALSSTNYLKSIITAELPMDLEKKGEQSYQGRLCVRFMAFGNGMLRALHDRSHGFFRRQIILSTLPKDPRREDDPELGDKLIAEKDAIFMWCYYGLCRLMENNFRFTISPQAEANLLKAESEGNNILDFLGSTGYITFDYNAKTTSRRLYEVYRDWCADNALRPLSDRSFWSYIREHALELDLDYVYHIPIGNGKTARGFRGIRVVE
jgi:putative DNA primase/helicase